MSWFNMAVVSTIDLVLRAVQPAMPERVTAGSADNIGMPNMSGIDPRTGKLFQTFAPFLGGWGARIGSDGPSAVVSLVQGDVRFMPVEVQETVTPVRVLEFGLHADSGGAGAWRGGLGIVLKREMLADCDYHGRFERTRDAPWGFDGGRPGRVTHSFLQRDGDSPQPAPLKCEGLPLKKGDIECASTSGGGGYGNPLERDPESVRRDVLEGYVTLDSAREQYGVVLDPQSLAIDEAATRALRAAH
jgi:N-methylhydantoinase B